MRKDRQNFFSRLLVIISVIISVVLLNPQRMMAASDADIASSAGFTYVITYPENQITADSGYFDLMMEPSQQQTLLVTITNPGEEEITVNLALNGAKTNRTGVIEYANSELENDSSYRLVSLI